MSDLRKEIEAAINRCNGERGSNTPDYILADYFMGCLAAFDAATVARDKWRVAGAESVTWTRPTEQDVPPSGCKFMVEITRHGEMETLVYPTLQAAIDAATAVYAAEVCRPTTQGAEALKGAGIEAHPPTQRLARPRLTPDEIVLADNQIAALRAGIQNGLYSMMEAFNRAFTLADEMLPRALDEIDALKAELAEARAQLARIKEEQYNDVTHW